MLLKKDTIDNNQETWNFPSIHNSPIIPNCGHVALCLKEQMSRPIQLFQNRECMLTVQRLRQLWKPAWELLKIRLWYHSVINLNSESTKFSKGKWTLTKISFMAIILKWCISHRGGGYHLLQDWTDFRLSRGDHAVHGAPQSPSPFQRVRWTFAFKADLIEYDTKCHKEEMDNANQLISLGFIIKFLLPSTLPLLGVSCLLAYWTIFTDYESWRFRVSQAAARSQAGAFQRSLVLYCCVWRVPSDSEQYSRGVAEIPGE